MPVPRVTPFPVPRAEIIGLGLIGSSIGLRLRELGWHISGSDLNQARSERAIQLCAIDRIGSDMDASVVIIATPPSEVVAIASQILDDPSRPAVIVTDVAGVKARIAGALHSPRFLGGHPMAGSEQEGPDGADHNLFNGATWVLTPNEHTDSNALQRVREIVSSLGADPLLLSPERHDALVAVVSHLPHLTAANLMAVAADASSEHRTLLRLAAGGFRDMTRIAAGDPAIWPDIFRDNASAVLEALDALRIRLDEARRIVASGDHAALVELLDYAKQARRNLPPRVPSPEAITEFRVPVPDRPGVLAEVTTVLGGIGINIWDLEIAHSAEGDRGVIVLMISVEDAERAREVLTGRGYHPSIMGLT
ncbi:MAG TPA: prephenate dehydrogenase [Acidimicrobiales bacterium]|nr:prephenate dehydrogenase [Acidimicrobiales bacterium]